MELRGYEGIPGAAGRWWAAALAALVLFASLPAAAAVRLDGRVLGAGAPIANARVTLWAAGTGLPIALARARSGADGRFTLDVPASPGPDTSLYLVARGGRPTAAQPSRENPAIVLMTVLGSDPPARVTIDERTTVASVWTHAQFLSGEVLRGPALGQRIAAGNVPEFVDLETGGWGGAIQGPLNSSQTPTMANFATLADLLAGCVAPGEADACSRLLAAATPPGGKAPADMLAAAEAVARHPWYRPERLFALLDRFYPVPKGRNLRAVPYMPYLNFAPSAWVLPLKFDGGGYRAGGNGAFDSQGNLWVGDNFTVGWQAQDTLWQGNATKFAPNGRPLSPPTTGFQGGGMEGGTFGTAIDARDDAWFTCYGGKSIAVFDRDGRPLTPPGGITFDGQLGLMQGIMVAPSGDVWALGLSKNQVVHFPGGDLDRGEIVCQGFEKEPCKSLKGPFHLAIDQRDRIWVTSGLGDFVTRFPASDPSRAQTFKTGYSGSGLAIDSQGNVWVTNRFGNGPRGLAKLAHVGIVLRLGGNPEKALTETMFGQRKGSAGGSVSLLRPDGSQVPGSPFTGASLPGPWGVAVDGDDNVWVSNFAGASGRIAHLCGVRTENCPPGMKTGDPISPPGGYQGGGLQMQTSIAVDPAGNVWVMNNWQDIASCFGEPSEGLSTRCGGQGVVVFYGMAKPVRTPLIGPPRVPQADPLAGSRPMRPLPPATGRPPPGPPPS